MYHKGVICSQVPLFQTSHLRLNHLLHVVLLCLFKHADRTLIPHWFTHTDSNLSLSSRCNWLPDCSSGSIRSSEADDGWDHRVYLRMLPVPRHVTLGKQLICPCPQILFLPLLSPITHWVCDPPLHRAEVLLIWRKQLLFWTCCFFLSMLPATKAMVGSAVILLSRLLITVCCGFWD